MFGRALFLWQRMLECALVRMNVLTENLVLKRSRAESLEAVKSLNCWGCDLHDVRMIDSQSMFVCT